MKRTIFISLAAAALLSGCSGSGTQSHIPDTQSSVSAVLQAGMTAEETTVETTSAEAVSDEAITAQTEAQTAAQSEAQTAVQSETQTAAQSETQPQTAEPAAETKNAPADANVDIDLSAMNANMVYSEVFAMMTDPDPYIGKTIKMDGICGRYTDIETGQDYYACIIRDAAACCAQGIEFRLPDGEAYPQMDDEITVVGTFCTYTDGENKYCVLMDAQLL